MFQWMTILHRNASFPTAVPFTPPPLVPVYVALFIIMIFLGPVLLVVLAKRNRRLSIYWLVPSIAGAVSVLVLALALARNGVTPVSYSQSVLYLNEKTQTQVQLATLSMMAPVGLRSPLYFGASVEVMPAPASQEFSSGRKTVRNEGDLVLGSGWVPSRVPITFLLRDAGKLTIPVMKFEKTGDGGYEVTNPYDGFIRTVLYRDAEGAYFYFEGTLAEGVKGEMRGTDFDVMGWLTSMHHPRDIFFEAKEIQWSHEGLSLMPNTYICELSGSPYMEHPIRRGAVRHEGKTLILGELQ